MIASKEEERKALEKIRQIVERLGPDSYVAAAFDGCFEMAEENITNDWGISVKEKLEYKDQLIKEYSFGKNFWMKKYQEISENLKKVDDEKHAWKGAYEDMQENLENLLHKMAAKHSELIYNEHFGEK